MKKEWRDIISEQLGVEPVLINSALVSAQSRKRLYWTNIVNVEQPEDKGIVLLDIIDTESKHNFLYDWETISRYYSENCVCFDFRTPMDFHATQRASFLNKKHLCLICDSRFYILCDDKRIRKTTAIERERLQTIPDNYTNIISNSQRYKVLGNCFTVDVIAHILKSIEDNQKAFDDFELSQSLKSFDLMG